MEVRVIGVTEDIWLLLVCLLFCMAQAGLAALTLYWATLLCTCSVLSKCYRELPKSCMKHLSEISPLFFQCQHCSALHRGLAMHSCRVSFSDAMPTSVLQREHGKMEEAEKHNCFPATSTPLTSGCWASRSRRGTLPPCGNGPCSPRQLQKGCGESACSLLTSAVLLMHQRAKRASALCWSRAPWIKFIDSNANLISAKSW